MAKATATERQLPHGCTLTLVAAIIDVLLCGWAIYARLAHMFHAVSDFGTIAPDRVLVRDVTEVAG